MISEKLQSSINETIKNAEKQIEQDEGSLKLLRKIQDTKMSCQFEAKYQGRMKLTNMGLMTIPFAFIIALSVATQNIKAIKGQTGNILNPVASVCNNNVLCYTTTIEQEKEVE